MVFTALCVLCSEFHPILLCCAQHALLFLRLFVSSAPSQSIDWCMCIMSFGTHDPMYILSFVGATLLSLYSFSVHLFQCLLYYFMFTSLSSRYPHIYAIWEPVCGHTHTHAHAHIHRLNGALSSALASCHSALPFSIASLNTYGHSISCSYATLAFHSSYCLFPSFFYGLINPLLS